MFQSIERIVLELVRWFYGMHQVVGIFTLGALAFLFLFIQFVNRKKTVVPGVLSLFFFYAEYFHYFKREVVVQSISQLFATRALPRGEVLTQEAWEPLTRLLVGPIDHRYLYQEVLTVLFLTYIGLVIYHSIKEYKKTGLVVGSMSLKQLFDQAHHRPRRSRTNELGSGDLASTEQISRWAKPSGKRSDTVLHVTDLRGSEGIAFKAGKLFIQQEERNRHVLIVAKTGSGKTTRLILPVLYEDCLDPFRSTIVIDSKPEMWRKLAAMTRKYNPEKNVLLFNPLDLARSLSWNILGKIEDDTDCKLIANTIVMATDQPGSKADSPFFRNNALAILNSIMVGLLNDPNDTVSMPRIHELVQSGMKPLCSWLEAHPHALRNTRTFVELVRSGSQNADTIMSELSMRLSAWDLPAIRGTTSVNELNLEELITKPTLFIIELRESELEMLRPMANVIVVELLRFLTKYAERCPGTCLPRPVGLVIDEFASALGRIPDIHVKLNTLRSRNISIVAAIQSIGQIKANYSEHGDSVLSGFSTKIFIPSLDNQDAEWASKETGQMTIRFQTVSTGSNKKLIEWFASKNDSSQEQVQQRAVLTPDEVGRPADNICTFFFPNTPVFQGHMVPYFKIPEMLRRISEFDNEALELKLRDQPIQFKEELPGAGGTSSNVSSSSSVNNGGLPPGISDTRGWTDEQVNKKLEDAKKKLDWDNTTGSARKWWEAFEAENKHRMALVLRLAEELQNRNATVTEFFLAYVYSNTDNIQANLHYLDYTRLKKEEEKRKREAAAKNLGTSANPPLGSQAAPPA